MLPFYWLGVAVLESGLVPVGVDGFYGAGGVEFGYLFFGEVPAYRAEILFQLFFVAGADDYVGNGGALEQPVQRDLRYGFADFFGHGVERVDHLVEIFVFHRRAVGAGDFQALARRLRVWPR